MSLVPKLIFISLNEEWCKAITTKIDEYNLSTAATQKADTDVICGDIQSVALPNTAFVSPANSLGFMDGGIDAVLSRKMFPGVQTYVQKHIRTLGLSTALGRYYLPVGSAIIVPTNTEAQLIVAPTMFLPHNVANTRNVYYSVFAALHMWRKYVVATQNTITSVVFTSHCCGYGGMSPLESAKQMMEAYADFANGVNAVEITEPKDFTGDCTTLLLEDHDDEQPDNYDNREIKTIEISNLIK